MRKPYAHYQQPTKQHFLSLTTKSIGALFLAAFMFAGCKKDSAIDAEYPVIDLDFTEAFPKQCSPVQRGQTFQFRARFSDNVQLGSYSIDIHHNFDQHSHSTELTNCIMAPVKTPVKPFLLMQSKPLPQGLQTFEVQQAIAVPEDIDPGDYHFLIRLTDQEGWQTLKGISIKILE